MIRIPTHQPLHIVAVALIPRHGRKLLCVAGPEQVGILKDGVRASTGDYRLSWHDEARHHVVCHEVRERGVVTRWDRDHAYRPVSERLHEVEAKADAFEPMDEAVAA